MRGLRVLVSVASIAVIATAVGAQGAAAATPSPDYGSPAVWIPASTKNYSVFDRPQDFPVDMIVIHDIEGTYASAIATFQNPQRAGSAHYVIGKYGQIAQMVLEKNVAWHAGNWDYNTRAIGIEHEGYAGTDGSFTSAMYQASAHLIASICSRWGVRIDRTHVIGHNQVPDPNNPNLYGGSDHHWDPGPYWHWTNYIYFGQHYANALKSPPHMVLDATAVGGDGKVVLTWQAARSCLATPLYAGGRSVPITSYQIFSEPDHTLMTTVAGNVTTATVTGLVNGTTRTFSITAVDAEGTDSVMSNSTLVRRAPDAPATVFATPANGSAVISWTAPAFNGGSTITRYRVTTYLNGVAQGYLDFDPRYRMVAIFNLTNGSIYSFHVAAMNVAGTGADMASNLVKPLSALHQAPAQALPASPVPRSTPPSQSSPAPTPPTR
jgi:N-acetylmuramoyl-L-alanine amidase